MLLGDPGVSTVRPSSFPGGVPVLKGAVPWKAPSLPGPGAVPPWPGLPRPPGLDAPLAPHMDPPPQEGSPVTTTHLADASTDPPGSGTPQHPPPLSLPARSPVPGEDPARSLLQQPGHRPGGQAPVHTGPGGPTRPVPWHWFQPSGHGFRVAVGRPTHDTHRGRSTPRANRSFSHPPDRGCKLILTQGGPYPGVTSSVA